jgi:CheY-like chemotaxis protein
MKTILIVDDEMDVREMLNDFLKLQGYKTIKAENGIEALKILEENIPDAAIVDIEMPKMNGLEFARRVLNSKIPLPIIIISAYLEKYSLDFIQSLGVKSILRKPLNLMELNKEIQRTLNQV